MSVGPDAQAAGPVAPRASSTAERAAYARRMHHRQTARRAVVAGALVALVLGGTVVLIPVSNHLRTSWYLHTAGFRVDWQLDADDWMTGGFTTVARNRARSMGYTFDPEPIDPEIQALPNLLNVRSLSLDECSMSESGLAPLARLTRLEELNLTRLDQFRYDSGPTGLSDACLVPLQGLSRLRTLTLSGNRITDKGLAMIARLPNIQYLDLDVTDVTDAGLVHLQGMKNLDLVNLAGTLVTPAGLARLKQAMPTLEVTSEIPEAELARAVKAWRNTPR